MSMGMSSMSSAMSSMASMSSAMSMDMSSMSSSMMSHMSSMAMSTSMDMAMSSMDMSSMDMSSMAMSSMAMASSMTMDMDMGMSMSGSMMMPSSTMDMSMPMSTGSLMASNGSMADTMAGMKMMKMHMNMWLTPTYNDYPVLFQHLKANTSGKAFGIFLLIVVAAFFYKGITFTSWCLEVHWFKKWNKTSKFSSIFPNKRNNMSDDAEIMNSDMTPAPKVPNVLLTFLTPSFTDLFHDFIRAILAFISTMIIYLLMLVAMTYVLTYVFAVITGLALAEVFFNRIKIILMRRWEVQREIQLMNACAGQGQCNCGHHKGYNSATSSDDEYNEKSNGHMSHREHGDDCNCETTAKDRARAERHIERGVMENNRLQEQAGEMAPDLTPADGLH